MKSNQVGLTTIELMVAVGVSGLVVLSAVGGYKYYIPKAQAAEIIQMMEAQKIILAKDMQNGVCGASNEVKGKYGSLVISGTPVKSEGKTCASGCTLSYTFNAGSHADISGKLVQVNVLNNLKLSKTSSTTLAEKYLPKRFAQAEVVTGDNCAAMALTDPEFTEGTVIGTEVGDVGSGTSSPPEEFGGGTPTEPDETTDPEVTTPSGSITPDVKPSGVVCADSYVPPAGHTIVMLDSKSYNIAENSHYVKKGVNLLNEFTKALGRAPKTGEKIQFVVTCATAIIGTTGGSSLSGAAVVVGDFDSSVSLTMANYGVIAGLGGNGGGFVNSSRKYCQAGENGGVGIYNNSATSLTVNNFGVIGGGGGGGGCGLHGGRGGVNIKGGGGGAPYGMGGGVGYGSNTSSRGFSASLLIPGSKNSLSGAGGAIGVNGKNGSTNDNGMGKFTGGKAGLVSSGSVSIVNR